MKILTTSIVAAVVMAGASAHAATYDFKAAANSGGGIGESAYTVYDTSPFFVGPSISITAGDYIGDANEPSDAFVYFDAGNAGIGVCNELTETGTEKLNTATNGGGNLCSPSSDDGLTTTGEFLTFTANEAMTIDSLWLNSNHDLGTITDTIWDIFVNDVFFASYGLAEMTANLLSGTGDDVMISLGFTLGIGDDFTLRGARGPNSYVSGLSVTPVPLPAAGWLLIAGLGGLAAMRRKKA